MNVLNIMLSGAAGGLERAAVNAHGALTSAGCRVTTILRKNSWASKHMGTSGSMRLAPRLPFDILTPEYVRTAARESRADVILAHGRRAITMSARSRDVAPLVAVSHMTNYSITRHLDVLDGVIALTGHYRDVLLAHGCKEEMIRVVPNCIHVGTPPEAPFVRETPIIGALGRMHEDKGFDILVRACAVLKRENIKFRCVIHGGGEGRYASQLKSLSEELGLTPSDVSFPGWTDDPAGFLRSIDIFCMPSRREVLSLALLDALAAGRPIVCARVPGLEDAFEDGREGLFVDRDDPSGLAAALSRILGSRDLARQMGEAARRRALLYDLPRIGSEMRAALTELSARRHEMRRAA